MICFPFLRQFGAPEVFFPRAPACTWNCMAPLSSFSPSIWRPWRFLPWSHCLHLKLHGPSRPFLRQFGAPDVFFPGAPACTWNCMAPLSSFSPSIWRPWRFLPWSPCLHLKLHGAPLVLFSVNLAPLTFSSLEPLLALETAWRPSRPFLRQFGAPDVFFPWSPCLQLTLHGASLVLFSVNLAPRRFLPWSPCLHLKLHGAPLVLFVRQFGAPDVFFPGAPACTWNCMAHLLSFSPSIWRPWRFSSLEPLLALETAWRPFRHIDLTFFLSFFFSFLLPLSSLFSFLFPSFPLFSSFLPSLFLSLFFFLSFWRPFGDPGGPGPQSPPPKIRPCSPRVQICLKI